MNKIHWQPRLEKLCRNRQPALQRGLHFLLYNNLWGTNFPMWFEDDSRFRFWLRFSDVSVIT